jgi:hypothetical protein
MRAMAADEGCGWFIPTSDASWWELSDPEQIAWANSKPTPQPIKTHTDKIGTTDRAWSHPGTMTECAASRLPELELERQRARAQTDAHFYRREIDACHEPMIIDPEVLAQLLVGAASDL